MEHLLSGGRARGIESSLLCTLIAYHNLIGHKLWRHHRIFSYLGRIQAISKSYQFDFGNMSGFWPIVSTSTAVTLLQATISILMIVTTSLDRLQAYFQYGCQSDPSTRKSGPVSLFQMLCHVSSSLRVKYCDSQSPCMIWPWSLCPCFLLCSTSFTALQL